MARDARELRGGWTAFQQHWYGRPAADLAPFVSHYWFVEWDLRGQAPYRQKIVPYPTVHLTFLNGVALVRGLERRHVVRVLEGQGRVFGVTFRPGCFRPFLGSPVSGLTGRSVPAAEVLGPGLPPVVSADAGAVEDFLRARRPAPDPLAETAAGIVALVQEDPRLTRVDLLAARAGLGVRRLQRLMILRLKFSILDKSPTRPLYQSISFQNFELFLIGDSVGPFAEKTAPTLD